MKLLRALAALAVLAVAACTDSSYALSNWAIQRELLAETPPGTPRAAVDKWMHDRRIPSTVIPLAEMSAPPGTVTLEVGEMNNEGRIFDRDVDVFYFFGTNDRLITLRVRQPASDSVTWGER